MTISVWTPGRSTYFADDVSALISAETYRQHLFEFDFQIAQSLETPWMHVHSGGAYLVPEFLKIPGLVAIQIVNDHPAGPTLQEVVPLLKRIQETQSAWMSIFYVNEGIAMDQLEHSSPEAQGVSSTAILAFVEEAEENLDALHSFMLLRHGQVVAQGWWAPYGPEHPHQLYSLSKSFTSTAVGMAVAEGLLKLDDDVLSFFPEDAPAEPSDNLQAMRMRQLLSMSTGHTQDNTFDREDGNWIRGFLEQPVEHKPGTYFFYNTGATYMLSAIVQKVSGVTLLDYLQPRLFEPLGIEGATWESSPQGINVGGWGLKIKTEDIARLGQLYLQKGVWRGRRLLSEEWEKEATSHQVSNGSNPESDWDQGYGYKFWRCRHNVRVDAAYRRRPHCLE